MKTGVLVLNFGGPASLAEVRPFLYRLFADPDVLAGVWPPFRQLLALTIALVKSPSSRQMYASIGGSSPQLRWTNAQVQGLRQLLADRDDVKVEVGMRLSAPDITSGLRALKDWGAERVVLMPLFSQFSLATTASCFNEVTRCLRRLHWQPEVLPINEWCDNADYITLLRQTVDESVEQAKRETGAWPHVLFSAHSLPMKIIERGDPYLKHIERTVQAVTKDFPCTWSLAYQSRNGPIEWVRPYVEDEIPRLAGTGVKNLVIVPVSFVCDHVETLFEIDQAYAQLARSAGIQSYYRSRMFNDDPEFPRVLRAVLAGSGYL